MGWGLRKKTPDRTCELAVLACLLEYLCQHRPYAPISNDLRKPERYLDSQSSATTTSASSAVLNRCEPNIRLGSALGRQAVSHKQVKTAIRTRLAAAGCRSQKSDVSRSIARRCS